MLCALCDVRGALEVVLLEFEQCTDKSRLTQLKELAALGTITAMTADKAATGVRCLFLILNASLGSVSAVPSMGNSARVCVHARMRMMCFLALRVFSAGVALACCVQLRRSRA